MTKGWGVNGISCTSNLVKPGTAIQKRFWCDCQQQMFTLQLSELAVVQTSAICHFGIRDTPLNTRFCADSVMAENQLALTRVKWQPTISNGHDRGPIRLTLEAKHRFYSASALLAMQSAVLDRGILSVRHVPVLCPDEWRYDCAVFSIW